MHLTVGPCIVIFSEILLQFKLGLIKTRWGEGGKRHGRTERALIRGRDLGKKFHFFFPPNYSPKMSANTKPRVPGCTIAEKGLSKRNNISWPRISMLFYCGHSDAYAIAKRI